MKTLSREGIQRMIDGQGASSGGGGGIQSLAGYATQAWTEENYLSKPYFNQLFTVHTQTTTTVVDDQGEPVGDPVISYGTLAPNALPGTTETTDEETGYVTTVATVITSIEAKFGFWSQSFISALGQGSGGGGGATALTDLVDVAISSVENGQVLMYDSTLSKWVNGTVQSGNYLPLTGGTMANTNLVTNMNADLLDGLNGADYLSRHNTINDFDTAEGQKIISVSGDTTLIGVNTWGSLIQWGNSNRTPGTADNNTWYNQLIGLTNDRLYFRTRTNGGEWTTAKKIAFISDISDMATKTWVTNQNYVTSSALSGYASQEWVGQNYLSIAFFRSLFKAYTSANAEVVPNSGDTTTIANIKAMFGFWTEQYISALGQNSSGGGGGGASALTDLTDVEFSGTPSNGQVLKYNGTTHKWYNGTDEGVTSLAWSQITDKPTTLAGYGITDAYTKTEADGKFLTIAFFRSLFKAYTSANAEVVPNSGDTTTIVSIKAMFGFWTQQYISALGQNSSGGGGGASALTDLVDVAISSVENGQVLMYDSTLNKWVNGTVQSGGATTLTALTDVAISSVQNDQVLTYNSTSGKWVNGGANYMSRESTENAYDTTKGLKIITISNDTTLIGKTAWGSLIQWGSSNETPGTADDRTWYNQLIGLTNDRLYFRTRTNGGEWTTVKKIAFISDFSSWALAATKPSYAFSELTSHPTTLSGYGITDAYINSGTIYLGGNSITPLTSFTETDPTVPAWAKASTKPSYSFSELTSHPTTLSGYGITDAYINSGTIYLGSNSITPLTASDHPSRSYTFTVNTEYTAKWHRLGNYKTAGNASNFAIMLYTGSGYNANPSQNSFARLVVKDGWQQTSAATNSVGVTLERFGNFDSSHEIKAVVVATSANEGALWVYLPWQYADGNYTISGVYDSWTHNSGYTDDMTTEPTSNQRDTGYFDIVYNKTYPQFSNLRLRPGTDNYGSYLYFGDGSSAFLAELSDNHLTYKADSHTFNVSGNESVQINSSGLRIGGSTGVVLSWDSTNNALKVQKADGTAANFYATGGVSALGQGSGGGGGGATALTDLTDVEFSGTPSDGQVLKYNGTTHKWYNGNDEGLTSLPWSSITGKPTTLSGYGITDAYISSGTIYLGGNSITPLTSFTETDPTVPAWAKAATKPSYTFSELTSHPTTISGYGITDAYISSGTIYLGGNSITPLTSFTETDPTVPAWAKAATKPSYTFSELTGTVAFSQLPTMYWADVAVSNSSNNNTSPQFGNLRLRPGSDNYGSYLRFGDGDYAYIAELSDDQLTYRAGSHTFNVSSSEAVQINSSGLRIGGSSGVVLSWDSTNNALKVQKADGTAANLYATGGVSALGMSAGTSSVSSMTFNYLKVNNELTLPSDIIAGTGAFIVRNRNDGSGLLLFNSYENSKITSRSYYYNQYDNLGLHGTDYNYDKAWWIDPDGCAKFNRIYLDNSRYLYVSNGTLYYFNGSSSRAL